MKRQTTAALWVVALVAGLWGCGGEEAAPQTNYKISMYGWGPQLDGTSDGFVNGMPNYTGAEAVVTKITKPSERSVAFAETTPIADRAVEFPEVPFGEGWRIDAEVLDLNGDVVANGSTDIFAVGEGGPGRALRMMLAPTNGFAPAGSVVADRTTGARKFSQSRLDYRGLDQGGEDPFWLGRVGHRAVTTSDGKVLMVGGADVIPGYTLGSIPRFRQVFDDVQVFDPSTGYFTDLSYDEASEERLPDGGDRLSEPRAFHTVTPLGEDRFLVVGGFTARNSVTRAVNTIDLIDLNEQPGRRVRQLTDASGVGILLAQARGYHTASLASSSGIIVISGGIGREGQDDFLGSVELIDLSTLEVLTQSVNLSEARAEHEAVVLGDGETIWVLGGRAMSGALASTEVIRVASAQDVSVSAEAAMKEPRFNFASVLLSPDAAKRKVMVLGGFTDTEGTVTSEVELGEPERGEFVRRSGWKLLQGRGGLKAVELPQTFDIVVLGGRGGTGETLAGAERLAFRGLAEAEPFETLSDMGSSSTPRYLGEATFMATGQILITGGIGRAQNTIVGLDTAEVFNAFDPVGQVSSR